MFRLFGCLNVSLTRRLFVQRESKEYLVMKDANLCFVRLNVSLTRRLFVQRESKEYLVMKDINLCFV